VDIARVAHLIEKECRVATPGHAGGFCGNWDELPTAQRTGAGAGRREIRRWKQKALAEIKKRPKNEGRTIVFIDESGLSQRPRPLPDLAPRGQTPVLQYHFNWKTLSAMAG